jgi:TRAP-type mannitol/chloroaromatic compound transport system permease small subunit
MTIPKVFWAGVTFYKEMSDKKKQKDGSTILGAIFFILLFILIFVYFQAIGSLSNV